MTSGKLFDCRQAATSQRALVLLLEQSPMPWTWGMLFEWFGARAGARTSIRIAREMRRIRRVGYGLYTSPSKYQSPIVTITSGMLYKRFGIRA